jgi:hypothetical protein
MKETRSSVNNAIAARIMANLANCTIGGPHSPLAPVSGTIARIVREKQVTDRAHLAPGPLSRYLRQSAGLNSRQPGTTGAPGMGRSGSIRKSAS